MRIITASPFQKGFDTVLQLSKRHCEIAKSLGFEFAVRYFYNLSQAEIDIILDSGLGLIFVNHANNYDYIRILNDLEKYGIPEGATIFHDIEDTSLTSTDIIVRSNQLSSNLQINKYISGAYYGSGCVLTSEELYNLKVTRYWNSISREMDRNNKPVVALAGDCMMQLRPGNFTLPCEIPNFTIDANIVQQDFKGRYVTMVVK